MPKVVLNNCYGGFGLSTKAILRARELGYAWAMHPNITLKDEAFEDGYINDMDYDDWCPDGLDRHDPTLISLVEEMGNEANGRDARLIVVDIPDLNYVIDKYDGQETVHAVPAW